jgi:hypothetical protein
MTAGLLHMHGAWVGTCREGDAKNPRGYFESVPQKHLLKGWYKAIVAKGIVPEPKPGWKDAIREAIRKDGYSGGPWLMKHSALYWKTWGEFENPKWVICRRDPEDTFQSCRRSKLLAPNATDDHLRHVIRLHHEQMDIIRDRFGGVEVDTQAVAKGDFDTIAAAVEHAGLDYSEQTVREFVDPSFWHFGA